MAEFPSHNFIDDAIPSAAQFNASHRAASRAHMTMLGLSAFNGVQPADGTGAVFGGLKVSAVSGTMRSQVSAGTGIYVDSSAFTSPLSPFGLVLLETADTTSLTHATADGTHPRIDIVCIRTQAGTQTAGSVLQIGGGSLTQDTVRGPEVDIAITTGTAAASPAVPATPAGYVKLAEVYVPATETDADDFRYIDVRPMRSMTGGPLRAAGRVSLAYTSSATDPPVTTSPIMVPDGVQISVETATSLSVAIHVFLPSASWGAVLTVQPNINNTTKVWTCPITDVTSSAASSTIKTDVAASGTASPVVTIAEGQRVISFTVVPMVSDDGGEETAVALMSSPVDFAFDFTVDVIPA